MKRTWFKYLLIFVCLFSVLERTGISLSTFFTRVYLHQTDARQDTDNDATENSEIKETNLKEFWTMHQQPKLSPLFTYLRPTAFVSEQEEMHLAWIPPVPTPPPNRLI